MTPLQALCLAERCALLTGPGHRLRHERLRRLDRRPVGRAHGRRGMGRQGLPASAQPSRGSRPTPWTGSCGNSAAWSARHRRRTARTACSTCLRSWPNLMQLGDGQPPRQLPLSGQPVIVPPAKATTGQPPNYLFLGPKGGHPRRSNYADRLPHPSRRRPLPGPQRHPAAGLTSPPNHGPVSRFPQWQPEAQGRRPGRRHMAEPDRQIQASRRPGTRTPPGWMPQTCTRCIQMDRRGHAMPGMDAVYNHITAEMRQQLCDVLEKLWHTAVAQRRDLAPGSASSAAEPNPDG